MLHRISCSRATRQMACLVRRKVFTPKTTHKFTANVKTSVTGMQPHHGKPAVFPPWTCSTRWPCNTDGSPRMASRGSMRKWGCCLPGNPLRSQTAQIPLFYNEWTGGFPVQPPLRRALWCPLCLGCRGNHPVRLLPPHSLPLRHQRGIARSAACSFGH